MTVGLCPSGFHWKTYALEPTLDVASGGAIGDDSQGASGLTAWVGWFGLILVIVIYPIRVLFSYALDAAAGSIQLSLRWGIWRYRAVFGPDEWTGLLNGRGIDPKQMLQIAPFTLPYWLALSVKRVESVSWQTDIETGDAALTGLAAGMMWDIKGGLLGWLTRSLSFSAPPDIQVKPDFDRARLSSNLTCIFRFSLGQIIVVTVASAVQQWRKGRSPRWMSAGTRSKA